LQIRGFKTDTKVPVLLLLLKMPLLEEFYYDDFLSVTAIKPRPRRFKQSRNYKSKEIKFQH